MHKILFFKVFFIAACVSQNNLTKEGFVNRTIKFYDSLNHQYTNEGMFADINIWYRGNSFIEEIKTVEIFTDTNRITTRKTPIAYYLYIDRNSKTFYHYTSFSDTAKIIDKYLLSDTDEIKGLGGWSFYKDWNMNIVDSLKEINDTIIGEVFYKRVQIPIRSNNILTSVNVYQRCDKLGSTFQFDKNLGNKLGCPIVRIDYLPSSVDPIPISMEINFLRDSLSGIEKKVFDAWEKNLKIYPVLNKN